MRLSRIIPRRYAIVACTCLFLWVGASAAQDGAEKTTPKPATKKSYIFAQKAVPWIDVLEWLRDTTELPVVSPPLPYGYFQWPAKQDPVATLGEVMDLLNAALAEQKFMTLRRQKSITFWPSDEPVPLEILQLVNLTELNDRGKSEFAKINVPLTNLKAAEMEAVVKKMLSPLGRVKVDEKANELLLADNAASLRAAVKFLQEKDAKKEEAKKKQYVIPEAPWAKVLDWLRDETELPVIPTYMPKGEFRLPVVHQPITSLDDVIDVLNETLLLEKFILVRRQASFAVWPVDEPHDERPRAVTFEQLIKEPNSAYVRITLQLTHLNAEDVASAVKEMMTPFGQVIPVEEENQLILLDNAKSLRMVVKQLLDSDRSRSPIPLPIGKTTVSGMPRNSWIAILDWLGHALDLPFNGRLIPTVPLRGPLPQADALLNTGELIDRLNASLQEQKLLLFRGERGLYVVWTDESIDPSLIPQIRWVDLPDRGKTEPVSIVFTSKRTKVAELIPLVRRLLSPSGTVHEMPGNQLVLQDTAERLQAVLKALR